MGAVVSSLLDFINKNPNQAVSFGQVEHELEHIKKREHLSNLLALAGVVTAMISMMGIFGGGAIVLGALLAVAAIGATYAYFCRLAEMGLRSKQISLISGSVNHAKSSLEGGAAPLKAAAPESNRFLDFLSETATHLSK